jgi:hypothetical protein
VSTSEPCFVVLVVAHVGGLVKVAASKMRRPRHSHS